MPKCEICGKEVKDEPGPTKVIYNIPDDIFLCGEICENKRRIDNREIAGGS